MFSRQDKAHALDFICSLLEPTFQIQSTDKESIKATQQGVSLDIVPTLIPVSTNIFLPFLFLKPISGNSVRYVCPSS